MGKVAAFKIIIMEKIGLATIATDNLIFLEKGQTVEIWEYEAGNDSESKSELTENDFQQGHATFCATVYGGIGGNSSVSYDIWEDEFELIQNEKEQ